MAKPPYPGWGPNMKVVSQVGGRHRTCLIIDLLSDEPLTRAQMVALAERLEATVERGEGAISGLSATLITPDQFDPVVCEGLRLPRLKGDGNYCNEEVPIPE